MSWPLLEGQGQGAARVAEDRAGAWHQSRSRPQTNHHFPTPASKERSSHLPSGHQHSSDSSSNQTPSLIVARRPHSNAHDIVKDHFGRAGDHTSKHLREEKKVVSLRSRWLQGQIMQCTCKKEELWDLSTQVRSFSTLSLCFSGKFLCLITPQAERSCLVARFSWGMLLSRQGWLLSTQRSEGGRGWVCAGKDKSTPPLSHFLLLSSPYFALPIH